MSEDVRESLEQRRTPSRPRRRAVRLTDDATRLLTEAIYGRWEMDGGGAKLTGEARARLLGLSVATSDRILGQQGVDRNTLVFAFQNLGLTWDGSFCEFVERGNFEAGRSEEGLRQEAGEAVRVASVEPGAPRSAPWFRRWQFIVPATAVILVTLAGPVRQEVYFRMKLERQHVLEQTFYDELGLATRDFRAGNYQTARTHATLAVKHAREYESAEMLSFAQRTAADVAAAEGKFVEARTLYLEAITLRRSLDDPEYLPAILEALGDLEIRMGEYKSAEAHLIESLAGYQRAQDPGGIAMAYRTLGSLAFEQGDLDKATQFYGLGLDALKGLDAPDMIHDIRARQALVLGERQKYGDARAVLNSCLAYWTRRGHPRWIAKTTYQLAIVEAAAQDLDDARKNFIAAQEEFTKVGDVAGAADCAREVERLNGGIDDKTSQGG